MNSGLKKGFLKTLLGASIVLAMGMTQQVFANDGLVCKETTSIRDTMKLSYAERDLAITKTDKSFSFQWAALDPYAKVRWRISFNVVDPKHVNMALKYVRYDDLMDITINGTRVFNGVRNGTSGYLVDVPVEQYLVKGLNTMEIYANNTEKTNLRAEGRFEYSEGGCDYEDLPRPIIPNLPDNQKCVEQLVCKEGHQTKIINGMEVSRGCWNWETQRTCFDYSRDESLCKPPQQPNRLCEVVSQECVEYGEYTVNGQKFNACMRFETKTQCSSEVKLNEMSAQERAEYEAENERRRLLCKPVQTCVGDDCYITNQERDSGDGDMPFVLALLELGRQAGTYMDANNIRLFSGVASSCRSMRGFGAMAGCCEVKSPMATNAAGQKVNPTNDNAFGNVYDNVDQKYNDPNTSYAEDYAQTGSSPYVYDALYKPNEANYMLQGAEAMADTEAGQIGLSMGGGSTVTVMGYGWSNSGTATGDQQSFNDYKNVRNTGTPND